MKYYKLFTPKDAIKEHVLIAWGDGSFMSVPIVDDNDGAEYKAYLDWVAEGNEASVWGPDAPDWPA